MITLVWYVLSLFDVCAFSWLPIFIEAVIWSAYSLFYAGNSENNDISSYSALTLAYVAFYKYFFALSVSTWWLLLAFLVFPLALIIPGGFTIVNLILKNYGLITLPTWGLVTGIVVDALTAICMIAVFYSERKSRR